MIKALHSGGVIDLSVSAASLAQQVRIGSAGHVASDSYFTVLPGVERRVRLTPHGSEVGGPIVVQALNDPRAVLVEPMLPIGDAQPAPLDDTSTLLARGAA